MPEFKVDLTGLVFNRWTVLRHSHSYFWLCRCSCGTERAVWRASLKTGKSRSCGCEMRELVARRSSSHGMHKHPAYRAWIAAKTRCRDAKTPYFRNYGGRGIEFSAEWDSFEAFWAEMGPSWALGLSLDRIENDKGYGPGLCRWATKSEQANNTRANRIINTPHGRMTIRQASASFGVCFGTIWDRIIQGWPEDDLVLPARSRRL